MIILASYWLAISIIFCVYAFFSGQKWLALPLPLITFLVAYSMWIPTGLPRFTHPPEGKYDVLWADIEVDKAIYVLLTDGSIPIYYVLPYTEGEANEIQGAVDEAGEGGRVRVKIGGDGGEDYTGEPPVTGNPPKE